MVSNHSINIVERRGDALEIQQHRRTQGPLHMGLVQPLSDPLQQFDFLLYFRHDAPRSLICHNHFEMPNSSASDNFAEFLHAFPGYYCFVGSQ